MLTGLLKPSAGNATGLGEAIPGAEEKLRLRIGYMTQKFSLYDNLSVQENQDFVALIYGINALHGQNRTLPPVRHSGSGCQTRRRYATGANDGHERLDH